MNSFYVNNVGNRRSWFRAIYFFFFSKDRRILHCTFRCNLNYAAASSFCFVSHLLFFLKQVLSIGNNVNIKISTRANSVQVIVDVNAFLNVWFKIAFAVKSFTSEFLLNGRINVESVFELSDF